MNSSVKKPLHNLSINPTPDFGLRFPACLVAARVILSLANEYETKYFYKNYAA